MTWPSAPAVGLAANGHLRSTKQLARFTGQGSRFLQDAGVATVVNDEAARLLTGLEQQLPTGSGSTRPASGSSRHSGYPGAGWNTWHPANEGKQGNDQQRTGGTHLGVSWKVPPRYAGCLLTTSPSRRSAGQKTTPFVPLSRRGRSGRSAGLQRFSRRPKPHRLPVRV